MLRFPIGLVKNCFIWEQICLRIQRFIHGFLKKKSVSFRVIIFKERNFLIQFFEAKSDFGQFKLMSEILLQNKLCIQITPKVFLQSYLKFIKSEKVGYNIDLVHNLNNYVQSLLTYNQYNKIHQLLNMIQKEKKVFFQLELTIGNEQRFDFQQLNKQQEINFYIYLKRFFDMFFMILQEKKHSENKQNIKLLKLVIQQLLPLEYLFKLLN